jgi:hypothetical protein
MAGAAGFWTAAVVCCTAVDLAFPPTNIKLSETMAAGVCTTMVVFAAAGGAIVVLAVAGGAGAGTEWLMPGIAAGGGGGGCTAIDCAGACVVTMCVVVLD